MGQPGGVETGTILRPAGKAEPRFDRDYSYGRQGELLVGDFLDWIAKGNGQVEIKRKRIHDLYFYVETECDKGRTGVYAPSGIFVTTAAAWAFVIGDTGMTVLIPTDLLRATLDDPSTQDKREDDGTCPTRGKLVNLAVVLYRYKQRETPAPAAVVPPVAGELVLPARVTRDLDVHEIKW